MPFQNQSNHAWLAEDVLTDGPIQNINYYLQQIGALGLSSGLAVNRPATPTVAPFYYATDTQALSYWNGTTWMAVTFGGAQLNVANTFTQPQTMPVIDKGGMHFSADAYADVPTALAAAGTSTVWLTAGKTYLIPAGVTIPSEGRIASDGPDNAILSYAGTGVAVTIAGGARMPALQGVKVLTTNAAATVIGVQINATAGTFNYYHKLLNVTISAAAKTSGQVGLQLVNTATSSIYWGETAQLVVENWDIGIQCLADATLGINANRFQGFVRNCNTALDFGLAGDGNMFDLQMDTFTLGITGSGTYNQFRGRAEGGTSSKSYALLSGSAYNLLNLLDNSPTASTDLGTDNIITSPGLGQPKAWDKQPSYLAPYFPLLAQSAGTVPAGANNGQWVKLEPILKAQALVGVTLEVTVQSGNYDLGLYELVGTNLVRRASVTGAVVPGAGIAKPNFTGAYTVRTGHTYYLALSADNVVAQFRALTIAVSAVLDDVTGTNIAGQLMYASTGGSMYPLPSTVAIGGLSNDAKVFALVGR